MNIIITAKRNSGKTTYLKKFITNKNCIGFISDSTKFKEKFYFNDLFFNERYLSMETQFHEDWKKIGKYFINPHIFEKIEVELFKAIEAKKDFDYIVLDEIGRLELEGRGFDTLLKKLVKKEYPLILSIRSDFVTQVIENYDLKNVKIIRVKKESH